MNTSRQLIFFYCFINLIKEGVILVYDGLFNFVLGSWSIRFEPHGQNVVLRSMMWPGQMAYYSPSTRKHGWIYIGTGQMNADIGFLL
jgi:hypothetical protein